MGFFKKRKGAEQTTTSNKPHADVSTKSKAEQKLLKKYSLLPVSVEDLVNTLEPYKFNESNALFVCVNLKSMKKKDYSNFIESLNNDFDAFYSEDTLTNGEVFVAWTPELMNLTPYEINCEPALIDINALLESSLVLVDLHHPMSFSEFEALDKAEAIEMFNLDADLNLGGDDDEDMDESYEEEGMDDFDEDGEYSYEEDVDDDDAGDDDFSDEDDFGDEDFSDEDDFDDDDEFAGEEDFGDDGDFDPEAELTDEIPADEFSDYSDDEGYPEDDEPHVFVRKDDEIMDEQFSIAETQDDIYNAIASHVDSINVDEVTQTIIDDVKPLINDAVSIVPIDAYVKDSPEFEALEATINNRIKAYNSQLAANGKRLASELNKQLIADLNTLIGVVISNPKYVILESYDGDEKFEYMKLFTEIAENRDSELRDIESVVIEKQNQLRDEYDAEKQSYVNRAIAIAENEFDASHRSVLNTKVQNVRLDEENAIQKRALVQMNDLMKQRNQSIERDIQHALGTVIDSLKLSEARYVQNQLRESLVADLDEYKGKIRAEELEKMELRKTHEDFSTAATQHADEVRALNDEIEKLKDNYEADITQNKAIADGRVDKVTAKYERELEDLNRQFTNAKTSWESQQQSMAMSLNNANREADVAKAEMNRINETAKRFAFTVASSAAVIGAIVGFALAMIVH